MSRRTAVALAKTGNVAVDRLLEALSANMNAMTGQEANARRLVKVDPTTATTAELAELLNAVVDRLQGTD